MEPRKTKNQKNATQSLTSFSFSFVTHADAVPFPLTGVRRGGAIGGGRDRSLAAVVDVGVGRSVVVEPQSPT
ncbi:hypothetical protein DEO72_LG10g3172 [Vigna unguiculata]|uniref:Uncharacterized protein n=1 Tax=Vigna unguiculata TaxID=3917 RepID=A0A4D6NDK4_VIGUN|nr:hypothetical protein DEO72_LG10g3172 [Vigna unguiculata]